MSPVIESDKLAHCEPFLTVPGLARLLGVSVHTIYEWNSLGIGPAYYKIGRYVRYERADVEDWLAARRQERRAS